MNKISSIVFQFSILCSMGLLFSACSDSGNTKSADGALEPAQMDPTIAAVFVDTEPANFVTVSEARSTAKSGDSVVVAGKVAGAMNPFTEGFATAVLADEALETCDLIPGDACETPWDACCVDSAIIKSLRLTIQVVDAEGRPIAQSLKGLNGLKELDPVVVSGTVAEGSTKENLIINVSSLYQKSDVL